MTEQPSKTEVRQGDRRLMNTRVLLLSAILITSIAVAAGLYASL
ncbi:MAG: hypothetical protein AAGB04_11335 [Pseudomonadota bacterium]